MILTRSQTRRATFSEADQKFIAFQGDFNFLLSTISDGFQEDSIFNEDG